jgi:dCTP deaminase
MSTITRKAIEDCLKTGALVITPLLSQGQINQSSVDVRLGNQFIVFRPHRLGHLEPFAHDAKYPRKIQERQIVQYGETLVLHPGVLVLACTLEYVSIPLELECQVEGRSSWARFGLQIATASSVEPGFKGVITLELSNVGTVPLTIMPGVRVAQLVFHDTKPVPEEPYGKDRKYHTPVGPEFSKLYSDDDWKLFADGRFRK